MVAESPKLIALARLLHQHAMADRPFVTLKPGTPGMEALAAAAGGTLCVWRTSCPTTSTMSSRRCADRSRARCSSSVHALIPPLADRAEELHRIIDECAAEAISLSAERG